MTDTLQDLGLAVKQLQWRHERIAGSQLHLLGVSLPQWNVLLQVDRHPGASLRDLAGLTFQTEQAMGAMAGRMIEKGLVVRVEGGGRAVRLALTTDGERLLAAGAGVMDDVLSSSFTTLDEAERSTLLALLHRVLTADTVTVGAAR